MLSGLLLGSVRSAGPGLSDSFVESLGGVRLSPSSYFPEAIMQLSQVHLQDHLELVRVAAQFHHFPAWVQLPEFDQHCLTHIGLSSEKEDFLLFANHLLNAGKVSEATRVLEECQSFNCPVIYRQK